MTFAFEELDHRQTALGEISLRRRTEPRFEGQVLYEVKLGDEYLMSSRFTEAEIQLARLALATLGEDALDVVVGGLGLGYTAVAALEHPSVASLTVVEVMEPVIEWHRRGLVPLGGVLTSDSRCTLVHDDFFERVASRANGFDPARPDRLAHAVLLDIDHSPRHWLASKNAGFYTPDGLRKLARMLHPGGVFGLWSNDPPDDEFSDRLDAVFERTEACIVSFPNPYTGEESSNTVYLAHDARWSSGE